MCSLLAEVLLGSVILLVLLYLPLEVISMVQHFLTSGNMFKQLNHTFLALIPRIIVHELLNNSNRLGYVMFATK